MRKQRVQPSRFLKEFQIQIHLFLKSESTILQFGSPFTTKVLSYTNKQTIFSESFCIDIIGSTGISSWVSNLNCSRNPAKSCSSETVPACGFSTSCGQNAHRLTFPCLCVVFKIISIHTSLWQHFQENASLKFNCLIIDYLAVVSK